jgi:hypothetical protein
LGRPRRGRSPGAYLAKKSPGEHPAPTELPGELPGEHRVTYPASYPADKYQEGTFEDGVSM